MLNRFLPKQANFFNLFQEAAQHLVGAAEQFHAMQKDLINAEKYAKIIAEFEAQGDNVARQSYDLLYKTFITPFDRHDILQLVRKLDDILDLINRTAKRIALYHLQSLPSEIEELAQLGVDSTNKLKGVLKQIANLKNADAILRECIQVNEAESRADHIKMTAVVKLFAQENDFKILLKTKEIIDYSKLIVSECHHLANIIKGIVMEYS
jgi:predicted phosphate transport protein (TIGR00153 family)